MPAVTQPNGPGTLPIRFDWHGEGMWEIVTAHPTQREIVLKVGMRPNGALYIGDFTRLTTLRLDGKSVNKFRQLRAGVFAYVDKGEAFLMQSAGSFLCFGPGELWTVSQCTTTPFNGYGTLIAFGNWEPHSNKR